MKELIVQKFGGTSVADVEGYRMPLKGSSTQKRAAAMLS